MTNQINTFYIKFEEVINEKEERIDVYEELKELMRQEQGNTITTDDFGGSIKGLPGENSLRGTELRANLG